MVSRSLSKGVRQGVAVAGLCGALLAAGCGDETFDLLAVASAGTAGSSGSPSAGSAGQAGSSGSGGSAARGGSAGLAGDAGEAGAGEAGVGGGGCGSGPLGCPVGERCDPFSARCVGSCAGNQDCLAPRPWCDAYGEQICVECFSSAHCTDSARPFCVLGTCVACTSDHDCASPTPRCDLTSFVCVQCDADWQCPQPTSCSLSTHTCE